MARDLFSARIAMTRKKLPIGIQSFAKIREGDYYYIDKTPYALRLIEEGKCYFLSRPRRFGKSLFLDTLGELFQGNEALFRGLDCHGKWDWSVKYPVIRISFGSGVQQTRDGLTQRILEIFHENEQRLGLESVAASVPGRFANLILEAERKFGQRVVVLVDEYDKPILDNLARPELAREMRDGLHDLYSVVKDQDAHIQFALLAGVSRLSKVNIFSGLNNLFDITISPAYSAICGYTDHDVDTVFAPELPGLDREEIRDWYNGYNWTGEAVYNPFDLLLLFDSREFSPYWFETGTPTFLLDVLLDQSIYLPDLEQMTATDILISSFEVGDIHPIALLFQTGYLTIDHFESLGAVRQYALRFPNREVRSSLYGALLQRLRPQQIRDARHPSLYSVLRANDFAGLRELITACFAGIPADWHRKNDVGEYEGYYASVFYAYFISLGLDVVAEDASSTGRLDMAVRFNGHVYLFEFKVVEAFPEGRALQQIKDRGYAGKYRGAGQPIHLIGVEFSRDKRNIVGFEVESLADRAGSA
ncbi:MAG: ATP-binding protein [Azoarcus sp.]|jgi:hypothetical protein|nr:ATP-binding protein [Azoarcus sp.]